MKTFISWLLANIQPLSVIGFMVLIMEYAAFNDADFSCSERTSNMIKTMSVVQIPIALVFAIWAAKFTYQNFDEVWSRRMSWNNSNVDKMNTRFNYTSKIFFYSLLAGVGITGILYFIGWLIIRIIELKS
jgi:hypothetical protein